MTRAWFRRRLERDPRRWVLSLAALGALGAFAVKAGDLVAATRFGAGIALALLVAATTPATGVLALLAHGRLLWWTGKLLRGRARPVEIHAAFAWSELPFVVASLPFVLVLPLRGLAAERDPVPAALAAAIAGYERAAPALAVLAAVAALAGALLYVRYLGEAQGFGAGRAIANHLLALLAGLALFAAGVGIASLVLRGAIGIWIALLGSALAVALGLGAELAVRAWASAHRAGRGAAPSAS